MTPIVQLLNLDASAMELLIQSPQEFQRKFSVAFSQCLELARQVAAQTRAMHCDPIEPRWWGYFAIDPATRQVIGTCSFVNTPDAEGMVEIAYFTFPDFEGRGFATCMAQRLLDIAVESEAVKQVVAHTLPERNASTRILEKLGFTGPDEFEHPVDGKVWRWVKQCH